MALDQFKNDCIVNVSAGYASGVTSIVLSAGQGALLPAVPFNAKWYNATDYPNGYNDPLLEYVRVTNRATDTLTITRAQEGTADSNHNIAGKQYKLIATLTAKTLNSDIAPYFDGTGDAVFDTVGIGGAIQRSSKFEVKESGTASLTAGAAHQIISFNTSTKALALINTSYSTDAEDGILFKQTAAGVVSISTGGGSLLTSTHGITQQFYPADISVNWWAGTFGTNSSASIGFPPAGGPARMFLRAKLGTHATQGANYFNPNYVGQLTDGAGNNADAGEIGWEGNWTFAGGFTERRFYLWDHDLTIPTTLGRTLLMWQKSTEDIFVVGDGIYLDLFITNGKIVSTGTIDNSSANGAILSSQLVGTLTKSNANVRQFYGNYIVPTINHAGGTNTTFTVLHLDTVNTNVTGIATDLVSLNYGGSNRHLLKSTGRSKFTAFDAQAQYTDAGGTSRQAIYSYDATITDVGFTSPIQSNLFEVYANFASDPGSKAINVSIFRLDTAANATSLASLTIRGVNPSLNHNGTGTIATMLASSGVVTNATSGNISTGTGNQGTITNSSSGIITTARGLLGNIGNSSTGTISNGYGAQVSISNSNASGTLTVAAGYWVDGITNSGTIGTLYGYYVGNLTAGTQTNAPWAFYNADTGNSRNYFGLNAFNGFGINAPLSKVHIEGASGWIIQDEQDTDPTTTQLDSLDAIAVYNKNNKFVIAFNNAGTITYIKIPLDGSTTTWTQDTTAP